MKPKRVQWVLLFMLVNAVLRLTAQQGATDSKWVSAIRAKAEKGDAPSQFELAGAFFRGDHGLEKDAAKGLNWLRKSADQNHAVAQNDLGWCYANGLGVDTNQVEAVKWYRRAAEQNLPNGLNGLAWILATSASPAIRDGSNAVVYAEKSVAATNRKIPWNLGTLAAAYAETGQFEKAVRAQQEAIALLETEADKNDFRSRLKLYEAQSPYRTKD